MGTTDAETLSGITLHALEAMAEEQCFIVNDVLIVKPGVVVEWLEKEFGMVHEQAQAICEVLGTFRFL